MALSKTATTCVGTTRTFTHNVMFSHASVFVNLNDRTACKVVFDDAAC